jgi:hypothetical protein
VAPWYPYAALHDPVRRAAHRAEGVTEHPGVVRARIDDGEVGTQLERSLGAITRGRVRQGPEHDPAAGPGRQQRRESMTDKKPLAR